MARWSTVVCAACVAFGMAQDQKDGSVALLDADRRFDDAVQRKGVAAWVEAFAEDGVQLVAGTGEVKREAMTASMGPTLGSGGGPLTWEPSRARLSASGDLGYTTGRYEMRRLTAGGEEQVEHGLYVTIWRRQADGRFAIELDTGVVVGSETR